MSLSLGVFSLCISQIINFISCLSCSYYGLEFTYSNINNRNYVSRPRVGVRKNVLIIISGHCNELAQVLTERNLIHKPNVISSTWCPTHTQERLS